MKRKLWGMAAKISLCMIVRDEEKNLPRALKSVTGAVDEIIVVDTGSIDRTPELAREHGASVYHHPWKNSFSEARNHSLDYATGDWILILDADEELHPEDQQNLRTLIDEAPPGIDGINMLVYQLFDTDLSVADQLFSVRIFRRRPKIRYWGRVHNQLLIDKSKTNYCDLRVLHYGWTKDYERKQAKTKRTRALLEQQLAETPDAHYTKYHLGGMYCAAGEHEKGIPLLKEAVEYLEEPRHRAKACYVLGINYKLTGSPEESERYFLKSLEIIPWFVVARYALADLYATSLSRLEEAIELMEGIVNHTMKVPPEFLDMGGHPHIENVSAPWNLAIYYQATGRLQEAIELLSRVTRQKGEHEAEVRSDLAQALLNAGQPNQAARELQLVKKIDSEFENIAVRLEAALELAGLLQEALRIVDDELLTTPDDQNFLTARGRLLMKSGRLPGAEKALKKAVHNSAADYEPPRLLLAECHRRRFETDGNPAYLKEAVALVKEVLAANPQSSSAQNILAKIQQTVAALST